MNLTTNILSTHIVQKKQANRGEFDNHINLNEMNIVKITLEKTRVQNIAYLTLKNNNIRNFDFLKNFPKLWSLDIRGNYIDNFNGITDRSLGHLALTLDRYTFAYFFNQKRIDIGILRVEGFYEINESYWNFLFNSQSNILKFNEEMITFNNEININFLKDNKFSHFKDLQNQSKNI